MQDRLLNVTLQVGGDGGEGSVDACLGLQLDSRPHGGRRAVAVAAARTLLATYGATVEDGEAQADPARLVVRSPIRGTVVAIASEGLLSEVVLRLADGQEIVAVVTRSSVRRLGLRKGQAAMAVIKATEVMLFA